MSAVLDAPAQNPAPLTPVHRTAGPLRTQVLRIPAPRALGRQGPETKGWRVALSRRG